jgi:hypothetical protein
MSTPTLAVVTTAVLCASGLVLAVAGDDEVPLAYEEPTQVELSDGDLEEIKAVMTQNAAVLVSSPGIKHVSAHQSEGAITAAVLFYPHEQSGGISHAVNANCHKSNAEAPWTCPSGSLRSYLQIPAQDFEVRVFGSIDYDAALALIDATGEVLRAHPDPDLKTANTVVVIVPTEASMTVGWGDRKGFVKAHVEAVPIEGGEARDPRGWKVTTVNGTAIEN